MKLLNEIARQRDVMQTMVQLTGVFEGIASMRISQIKDQVQQAEDFFNQLWHIYSQIRVDELFHFGRSQAVEKVIEKELFVVITAEGGFSGDIDHMLINLMIKHYNPDKNDIIVIGNHGAVQLQQSGIKFIRAFKMPAQDNNINVTPVVSEVQKYASTVVFYQTYVSLTIQDVKRIVLSKAVAERGRSAGDPKVTISEQNYIFEPSTYAVIDHLERSMLYITLSQVIMESKLAQYASRFRAMRSANDKADESFGEAQLHYNRARRRIKDERLKEVINGLRRAAG